MVVVTNLRGEDAQDVLPALRILNKKHSVLVASMSESSLGVAAGADIAGFDDALRAAGAHHLLAARERVLRAIRSDGVMALDTTPAGLSAELVNAYLTLKSAGSL